MALPPHTLPPNRGWSERARQGQLGANATEHLLWSEALGLELSPPLPGDIAGKASCSRQGHREVKSLAEGHPANRRWSHTTPSLAWHWETGSGLGVREGYHIPPPLTYPLRTSTPDPRCGKSSPNFLALEKQPLEGRGLHRPACQQPASEHCSPLSIKEALNQPQAIVVAWGGGWLVWETRQVKE